MCDLCEMLKKAVEEVSIPVEFAYTAEMGSVVDNPKFKEMFLSVYQDFVSGAFEKSCEEFKAETGLHPIFLCTAMYVACGGINRESVAEMFNREKQNDIIKKAGDLGVEAVREAMEASRIDKSVH